MTQTIPMALAISIILVLIALALLKISSSNHARDEALKRDAISQKRLQNAIEEFKKIRCELRAVRDERNTLQIEKQSLQEQIRLAEQREQDLIIQLSIQKQQTQELLDASKNAIAEQLCMKVEQEFQRLQHENCHRLLISNLRDSGIRSFLRDSRERLSRKAVDNTIANLQAVDNHPHEPQDLKEKLIGMAIPLAILSLRNQTNRFTRLSNPEKHKSFMKDDIA